MKLESVFKRAPVPGCKTRSIDQEPLENVELESNDEVVGFHNEMVVPAGALGKSVLSVLGELPN